MMVFIISVKKWVGFKKMKEPKLRFLLTYKIYFLYFFILIDDALQSASIVTLFLARARLGVQSPSHGLTIYINDCVGKPVESHMLSTTP